MTAMHATTLLLTLLAGTPSTGASSVPSAESKERIEVLWLDAEGTSGRLETIPLFLDGLPAEYHFGPRFCGRSHPLGDHTLRALHVALTSGQPVRVDAEAVGGSGGSTFQCIRGVAFFASVR